MLSSSSLSVWDDKGQTATFYKQRRKHPALWEDEGAEDAWTDGTHGACPTSLRAATVLYRAELSRFKSQMVCSLFKTALMMTLCLFSPLQKTARNCWTWTSWACPYNARARRTGEPAAGATETGDGETKTGAGAFGEGEAGEGASPYRAGAVSQQIMSIKPMMSLFFSKKWDCQLCSGDLNYQFALIFSVKASLLLGFVRLGFFFLGIFIPFLVADFKLSCLPGTS